MHVDFDLAELIHVFIITTFFLLKHVLSVILCEKEMSSVDLDINLS